MSKLIIIKHCAECPFHNKQSERVVKGGDQYWRHNCDLSMNTIWDEDRDGDKILSDQPIPEWCKLDEY